jgi:hypothetical protein
VAHVLVRRPGADEGELLGLARVAVFEERGRAVVLEARERDEVEVGKRAEDGAEQVGALGQRGADEETAVAAAGDGQALGAGVALAREVLAGRDEVSPVHFIPCA